MTIKRVEIRKDPGNHEAVGMGKVRTPMFELYVWTDDKPYSSLFGSPLPTVAKFKEGTPYAFDVKYAQREDGLVSFGLWYHKQAERPWHGGLWSSNGGSIEELTGKRTVEAVVNANGACHMDFETALKYTPSQFVWLRMSLHGTMQPTSFGLYRKCDLEAVKAGRSIKWPLTEYSRQRTCQYAAPDAQYGSVGRLAYCDRPTVYAVCHTGWTWPICPEHIKLLTPKYGYTLDDTSPAGGDCSQLWKPTE